MIDPDSLKVWCGQAFVGFLWRNAIGQIGFNYDTEWLTSNKRFALSVSLPLRAEDYSPEDGIAHRFFANLLPEGNARNQLVRDLKIGDNDFDLLRAIGGECAGALSLLSDVYTPASTAEYLPLNATELANLVKRKGQPATWKGHDRPRLSLAGAQNKCPVLFKDNAYWLPKSESPSSHILKFEVTDYRHLPAYETYTMQLAAAIGLEVANIHLRRVEKMTFAEIARYDRALQPSGQIARYHQEDFCQALGYGYQKKYQQDGGASFADCMNLLADKVTTPAEDRDRLIRWQIFNVLAGNSDGHAKNLSLLYLPGGVVRLAPFYDLICTRAIERIDENLAFSVGGERNPSLITGAHWDALANDCGLGKRYVNSLVKQTATLLLNTHQTVRETFEAQYGEYKALERIQNVIYTQCSRTLNKI